MNNEKLLELANELIGDVVNQKITGVSVDNTNYEDGSKRLSIDIDYVETSGFKAKIDGESFKTVFY
ncbi:hypothetical protein EFL98_00215 [Lactococcus lactis]|uniref:hypothetical protein n=1 Tax=Lactococcus lactis TaxID=1358 RepID=UPI00223B9EB4|nr:hypothetical protein [Lactococcus lactis]MCT1190985.1 hypothetical protein [Lactococcus lactis]